MTASTGAGCAVSFVSILILAAATAVQAEALVEHSLDAGQTYSTAGRIQLKDGDEERAVFQREPVTSSYWSQLQQLVQADRCVALADGRHRCSRCSHEALWPAQPM